MGVAVSDSPRYLSCADTAKLVRKALKTAFPDVKFSVRSDTYSGGASIRVGWTDGPTDADVEEVTEPYAGARFDGMIDLKVYAQHWLYPDGSVTVAHREGTTGMLTEVVGDPIGPTAELVRFGADFIPTSRRISDEWRAEIVALFEELLGHPIDPGVPVPLHVTREGEVLRMIDRETSYLSDLVHRYTATHARGGKP